MPAVERTDGCRDRYSLELSHGLELLAISDKIREVDGALPQHLSSISGCGSAW